MVLFSVTFIGLVKYSLPPNIARFLLSRVSTLARDIGIAIVCPSAAVRLSIRDVPGLDENGGLCMSS